MPARECLAEAGRRISRVVKIVEVSSNESLERRLGDEQPFDLIFPSDYLLERLSRCDLVLELDQEALPVERLAEWAFDADHDPGCRRSVPFAYGTTGFLAAPGVSSRRASWTTLFKPGPRDLVAMLDEVREVFGAALIATGHGPNDLHGSALDAARDLLRAQRPHVACYDSDDFVRPVVAGEVVASHAWSGPAAHAVREHPNLRYVVPDEGAVLWVTAGAIPAFAPDPEASLRLLAELMDPHLCARTTELHGYATPNVAARALLSRDLRDDRAMFPDSDTLARCHSLRDQGEPERQLGEEWLNPERGLGTAAAPDPT